MSQAPKKSGRKPKKLTKTRLYGGLAVSLAALAAWAYVFGLASLLTSVIKPLGRTMIFISIGLLIGQLLEAGGYSARLGRIAGPIIRFSRLPVECSAAFVAAFVSGITSNSMIYTAWQEGRISRRQLILSNLLNATLPAYTLHLPTTLFIIIPLVGRAGLAYLGLTLIAALLRMAVVLSISASFLKKPAAQPFDQEVDHPGWSGVWSRTWAKFHRRLVRMALVIVPIYLAISLAAKLGLFGWLKEVLAGLAVGNLLPFESMSVIIFALMAEFTSGFAAAGALLEAGELGFKEVVAALLIGAMIAAPVRALRHQMAHYMAIFSPKLGLSLLIISQSVRVASLALVTTLFIILW